MTEVKRQVGWITYEMTSYNTKVKIFEINLKIIKGKERTLTGVNE